MITCLIAFLCHYKKKKTSLLIAKIMHMTRINQKSKQDDEKGTKLRDKMGEEYIDVMILKF